MHTKFILFGICAALWLQSIGATNLDFCELENCKGRSHVSCEMPESLFGEDCPDDVHLLNLRNHAQRLILQEHNRLRNIVAGGELDGYSKAAHMGTTRWNVTFANVARLNVRRCKPKIDKCRSTPDFDYVGQNVAYLKFNRHTETRRLEDMILEMINGWFNQYAYANAEVMDSFRANSASSDNYNSFGQLVRDLSTRVGCAAALYSESSDIKTLLMACNYDLGLILDQSVYKSTDGEAGAGCATGTNPDYPNLCSEDERWDVNNFDQLD